MQIRDRIKDVRRVKASQLRPHPKNWRETYQVVVECSDEVQQQTVFERLSAEGYKCRLLML